MRTVRVQPEEPLTAGSSESQPVVTARQELPAVDVLLDRRQDPGERLALVAIPKPLGPPLMDWVSAVPSTRCPEGTSEQTAQASSLPAARCHPLFRHNGIIGPEGALREGFAKPGPGAHDLLGARPLLLALSR